MFTIMVGEKFSSTELARILASEVSGNEEALQFLKDYDLAVANCDFTIGATKYFINEIMSSKDFESEVKLEFFEWVDKFRKEFNDY